MRNKIIIILVFFVISTSFILFFYVKKHQSVKVKQDEDIKTQETNYLLAQYKTKMDLEISNFQISLYENEVDRPDFEKYRKLFIEYQIARNILFRNKKNEIEIATEVIKNNKKLKDIFDCKYKRLIENDIDYLSNYLESISYRHYDLKIKYLQRKLNKEEEQEYLNLIKEKDDIHMILLNNNSEEINNKVRQLKAVDLGSG